MRKGKLGLVAACVLALAAVPAHATLLTIDQVIYQDGTGVTPGLLSGTLDVVSISGSTITIDMRNTSPDAAFAPGTNPGLMLLTGFGFQLPSSRDIIQSGSSVNVGAGSVAVNFGGHVTPDISDQWLAANSVIDGYGLAGVLSVNAIVSSVNNGGKDFNFSGSGSIGGPGFGAISASESNFGASQPGVKDTIRFVLNLNGTAPSFADLEAGNVVLAFGSSESVYTPIPEPSTYALYGLGIVMLVGSGWWRKRQSASSRS